jgi:DNA-binding NtrC family response regulator/tetratricopeptide (TPR) repeat protein
MTPLSELLGECPEIRAVRETVRRLLAHGTEGRRLPALLILGETGTGKGLLVRALHRAGPRAAGPLVEVNCAAIPETLLEAELFGFERGAFTDARQPKPGLFQTAHGGILFLDEVGLLPERVQAKFLKVLEDGSVRRLGSTQSEPADVAIAAATSEDLLEAVRGRRFREDLYHRLAVVTVRLPSLAERGSDILLLAQHFLGRACADYGLVPKTLTPDARAALLAYPWPGNIRELANVMERAALLTETPLVTAEALGLPAAPGPVGTAVEPRARPRPFRDAMGAVEREHLVEALDETDWNIARAAARLQIPRGTLRYRIEKLGLRRSAPSPARVEPAAGSSLQDPAAASPSPPGPAREARPWERRRLAFLRAVLVPPPDRDLVPDVTRALEVLVEKVESFGGRVEELGPMGVVGVFGLEPIEDAPRRAAHAAAAIRRANERTRSTTADRVGARIAIHASQGLVGEAGETAVIDPEAKCQAYAALEGLVAAAEPDTILVSVAAAPALERRFELVTVGSVDSRGGPSYRLEGLERPGLAPRGPMTPLVGRGPELEQLRQALARAAAGHGQVVAIVGEPGVGKSRLVWEVMRAHRDHGWLIGHGTAVSYGQATPYLPVIDLLKAYFHVEDRDDPPQIREKVMARLLALDRGLEASLPALLALLDVPVDDGPWQALDPRQRRQRTLEAIKRLWLREARVQPVLLVFEDLHWVDSETQALLDSLIESLPPARLCLLVDYRPEYQHGWGSKTSYTQQRLDPLPPDSARELLRALLGDDAGLQRLTALLVERTEGNPFFLEETVQTLVETATLGGERGAHHLARPIDTIQVPATVEAVLAARIDRLPPEARRLLQAASVVGKDVPFALLQAIADVPEDALRRGLATLQAAEFVYEAGIFPDHEYTFKHALTHDVAYGSLLQDRRRRLHGQIVEAVQRLYPDRLAEHVERLAHHAFRAEVWEKALTYVWQAGAKALARSANRDAVAYFEQALTALTHLPETRATQEQAIDIRFGLRNAQVMLAEFGRVEAYLREAEALATTLDDQRRLGLVSAYMAGYHAIVTGRLTDARGSARRAEAIGEALGDGPLQIAARHYGLHVDYLSGDYRGTEDTCRSLMELLQGDPARERFGLPQSPAVVARSFLARALAERGAFDEGEAHGREALRVAEAPDHPPSLAEALLGLAYLHDLRGRLDQAVPLLERAVALYRDWNLSVFVHAMASLGHAYAASGRVGEGLSLLRQAVTAHESAGVGYFHSLSVLQLGEAYLIAGQLDDARAAADRGLKLVRERGEHGYEAWALRLLGEVVSQQDHRDRATADEHYRAAIALASELGMRPLVAHCHLGLSKLERRTGGHVKAQEHLTTATTMYREMNMGFWLAQVEKRLAT